MYLAGYVVAGFLLAGSYARAFLRGQWGRYEQTALSIAPSAAAIAAPLQVVIGDWAAREVAVGQPVKLAAIEGLGQTTVGAPEHLLGWYDGHQVVGGIEIPQMLSMLATTEVGRRPWIVYGVMRTSAAVTGATGIPLGYGVLIAVYAALAVVVGWLGGPQPSGRWWDGLILRVRERC
jgi:cytochrome bd-type quinol oxidase subunit 1